MWKEQQTKCFNPLPELRAGLSPKKSIYQSAVILYYWPFQDSISVVVLFTLCFGSIFVLFVRFMCVIMLS